MTESHAPKSPRTFQSLLITGGAGFIGSHVIRRLLRNQPQTRIVNLDALLQRCDTARQQWPAGMRVRCRAHEFGAAGLRADVRAARAADVLVGTHGVRGCP